MAAKCGAHVTLSDHEGNPHVHDNLRYSCQLNGVAGVEVRGVTWGTFSPAVLQLKPVDVILASDCFYDSNGNGSSFPLSLLSPPIYPPPPPLYSTVQHKWLCDVSCISLSCATQTMHVIRPAV